jgi:hypothetical protein
VGDKGTIQFKIQNSKFKIQNSKFKIQNSKFKIQNSKFKIQNSKFIPTPHTSHTPHTLSLLPTPYSLKASCCRRWRGNITSIKEDVGFSTT